MTIGDEIFAIARETASKFAPFGSLDFDEATSVAALRMCAVRAKLDGSRSEAERRGYLRRCAKNAILDRLRRDRAERRKFAEYVDFKAASSELVVGEDAASVALAEFRATLSPGDAVFWGSVCDGETTKEVAAKLGVSVARVRRRRRRLRELFAAYLIQRRDERNPIQF